MADILGVPVPSTKKGLAALATVVGAGIGLVAILRHQPKEESESDEEKVAHLEEIAYNIPAGEGL